MSIARSYGDQSQNPRLASCRAYKSVLLSGFFTRSTYMSYSPSTYIQKCRQLKIMPIEDRFDFLDLIFFFKIVKQHIPVILPSYLQPHQGHSTLRNSHMDSLCFVSSISPRTSSNAFAKNFFFRTHTKWNHIPLDIREIESITDFKSKLSTHMWGKIIPVDSDSELDYSIETDP